MLMHVCQVTISYVDGLEPRESRQQSLRQRYCFDCRCDRCCQPSPAPDDFLDAISAVSSSSVSSGVAHVELALQRAIDQGAQLFLVEVQHSCSRFGRQTPRDVISRHCDQNICAFEHLLYICWSALSDAWMRL